VYVCSRASKNNVSVTVAVSETYKALAATSTVLPLPSARIFTPTPSN